MECAHALAVVTIKRRDGSSISVTLSISPLRSPGEYIAFLHRRTDSEACEKALGERDGLFSVWQSLAEPVLGIEDHKIVYVNDPTVQTFGYDTREDLVGQDLSVLMQEGEAHMHQTFIEQYEATGERGAVGRPRGEKRAWDTVMFGGGIADPRRALHVHLRSQL